MRICVIDNKTITNEVLSLPYIIAEAGVNHEGSLKRAIQMIDEAAEAGADAIKFQSYKAEKLASKYSPAYWDLSKEHTNSQYELFKKYDVFGEFEYKELAQYCKKRKITFLSTPFDFEMVDFLDEFLPAYKIASSDITNLPFLKYIAKKSKPILLSTGASTVSEIWAAVDVIMEENNDKIILLHCVLNYPTNYNNSNLGMIFDMRLKFPKFIIGYSDHTMPDNINEILGSAWLLGANVLEKHFTFNKQLIGNDHYHAMDADDLKKFITHVKYLHSIVGLKNKQYLPSEVDARYYARRSLVANNAIKANQEIRRVDIAIKRPGHGIPPSMLQIVAGSVASRDIKKDEVIQYGDFKVTE